MIQIDNTMKYLAFYIENNWLPLCALLTAIAALTIALKKNVKEERRAPAGNQPLKASQGEIELYEKQANAYREAGKTDEAIAHYSKAIESGTSNPYSYFFRAVLLREKKRYADAVADLDMALELETQAGFHYERGSVLDNLGRKDEALADYSRAINLCPQDMPYAYFFRAQIRMKEGLYAQAAKDYDTAIRQLTTNPYFYLARAECRMALKNPAAAVADIRRAVEIGIPNTEHWLRRIVEIEKPAENAV